jgi:ATP-dependent DNA ligase
VERWVHEIKFDGYRVQVHVRDAAVKAFTRRGNDWTNRFRKIAADAWQISAGSVISSASDGTTDSVKKIRRLCSLWHRSPSDNILEFVVQTLRLGP